MKKKKIIPLLIGICMLTAAACGTDTAKDSDSVSGGTDATEIVISEAETFSTESTAENESTENSTVDTEASSTESDTESVSSEAETDSTEAESPSTETDTSSTEAESPSTETDSESESEEIPAIEDITVDSEEDGVLLLKALFGTEDDETGDAYVYIYLNTVTIDDVDYYAYTWSKDLGDHYSRLTDVFITLDGSAVYEGEYDTESCIFNTDNMLES